jgi:acetyltransferase
MGIYNLDRFFTPGPTALVGKCPGSDRSREWRLYHNLCESGRVPVYMVRGEVACPRNCPIPPASHFASLADLPEVPNLVVAFDPLPEIPALVDECGRLGIGSLMITTGRRSAADRAIADEILARARQNRVRILGFNSRGFIVPAERLNASLFDIPAAPGGLALLSQSGAVITSVLGLAREQGLGFSHVISLGALSDIDFGDLIDYLGWLPEVECILLYIENLKHVKKFMGACRSVARIKPIVAVRVGKSELGRKVIEKHTGCPAGEDRVYDTAFRRAGIIRVGTVEELLRAGDHLVRDRVPAGQRLGVITNSGGLGVLAVDGLAREEIEITALSPALAARLKRYIAPYSGNLDPICIAGDADTERCLKVTELCLDSREFDTLIIITVINAWLDPVKVVAESRTRAQAADCNLVFVWLGDRRRCEADAIRLRDSRTIICHTVDEAVTSCSYALRYHQKLTKLTVIPQRYGRRIAFDRAALEKARNLVTEHLERKELELAPSRALELFRLYGIPTVPLTRVAPDEAVARGCESKLPLALKIDTPGLAYRSDRSAVLLNLIGREALLRGVEQLRRTAAEIGLENYCLTLSPMIENIDYEVNLGSRFDIEFGPYIFLGTGGLQARIAADEAVILPPLDRSLARKLIERSRLGPGAKIRPFDSNRLEEILMRVSQMVVDLPQLEEIVLHPLVIAGSTLVSVDARVRLNRREIEAPHHLATIPYPNQYEFHETLKDGTPVLIRPIRPEDAAAHYELVSCFSRKTRYFRFFSYKDELTPDQMVRFTQIDYDREIAIIAEIKDRGRSKTIGINRLLYYPHNGEYEFAIVVADAWQGSGVGRLLMEKLIFIARDRGIKSIYGLVLRENTSMMGFARKFGFRIAECEDDVLRIVLDLDDNASGNEKGECQCS